MIEINRISLLGVGSEAENENLPMKIRLDSGTGSYMRPGVQLQD